MFDDDNARQWDREPWADANDPNADDSDAFEYDYEIDADDDGEPTLPCPYCGREIHEQSQRCPYCERYISAEDRPVVAKPWWIIIGAIAALYAIFRWIV